ncbi:MAG: AAA family ATPase [Desulfocapsa sp.]|nr:AAA family ATPase [Desulfocapsa sp.]
MYTDYFGLKENPFSISPDPRYLYMSELHREALAHLLYGIAGDGCFILLTGDVGTGKTTVCRCLLAQLPSNTDVALILNPRLTVLELLETICDELGIPMEDETTSVKAYIDKLNSYLLDAYAQGRNIALLIDEAQNLSLDLLEQLRLLTNLETDQKKLLKIVLLGQSELRQILDQPGAAQISQRITSRYHLQPLNRENSFAYIHHRLAVAGVRRKIFSKTALVRVYELSHGIPRLINVLCDRSLLGAYVEEKYPVSRKIVDKAAREVLGNVTESNRALPQRRLMLAVVLFLVGTGGVLYYSNRQSPTENMDTPSVVAMQVEEKAIVGHVENEGQEDAPVAVETLVEENEEQKTSIRIVPLEISD